MPSWYTYHSCVPSGQKSESKKREKEKWTGPDLASLKNKNKKRIREKISQLQFNTRTTKENRNKAI